MISPSPTGRKQQAYSAPGRRPRLLIVSDSTERLAGLRTSLAAGEVEVTCAISSEDLHRACRDEHHLVVIDVGPSHLVEVLKALRSSAGHIDTPVLVEASRLAVEPGLAGVLPEYRAMPCGQADLVTLARRRMTSTVSRRSAKKML